MRLGSFMVRGAVMRMHRSYRLWCLETTLRWWWDGAGDGPPDHSVDEIERVPIPQLHQAMSRGFVENGEADVAIGTLRRLGLLSKGVIV